MKRTLVVTGAGFGLGRATLHGHYLPGQVIHADGRTEAIFCAGEI